MARRSMLVMLANDNGTISMNLQGALNPAEIVFALEYMKMLLLQGKGNSQITGLEVPGLNPKRIG